jgi:galactokinase
MLDQLISAIGEPGKAFLIDFVDLTYDPVPLPDRTSVVVLDTRVRRGLVDSAYNLRVAECRQAAEYFGVGSLREVSIEEFQSRSAGLSEPIRRRSRHVITENARTLAAAEAMRRGDAHALGDLMRASHASLRDDYEVSCAELDLMVDLSLGMPGCYGARMTGAGFGGCAIALVEAAKSPTLVRFVASRYERRTGIKPELYVCQAAGGAEVITPNP